MSMSPEQTNAEPMFEPPELDIDPFTDEILRDPYPFFRTLRDAGAVVRLKPYGIYAVGRYQEAFALVSDHKRFTSTAGMGLTDIRKPGAWRTASPISEIDPPAHTRVRKALAKILSPAVIRQWQSAFEQEAQIVAERVLDRGEVDAVKDIAEAFVLTVFPRVLGVKVSRELFLAIGDMNFNQLGPNNERLRKSLEQAEPFLPKYEQSFQRESMLPGGFGEQIFAAEDAGELLPGTAAAHVRGFLRGGVDTTIAGLGFALNQLARDPRQWEILRDDPAKAKGAFEEAIRYESPAQVLFRTTLAETVLSGYRLAADRKVAYFMGSANRDPRKWVDPDTYEVTRRTQGVHLAFGAGVHMCIGQMIARLEAQCILSAIVRRAKRIELTGEPSYRLINTLRTLERLPLRITRA